MFLIRSECKIVISKQALLLYYPGEAACLPCNWFYIKLIYHLLIVAKHNFVKVSDISFKEVSCST